MSDGSEYKDKLYGVYERQREKLHDASLEAGGRYDRVTLTLGAGALGLSLTFLEKIAPNPSKASLLILIAAWVLLLASILTHFLALQFSQKALEWQIDDLDAEYNLYLYSEDISKAMEERDKSIEKRGDNTFSTNTRKLNYFSARALIVGLALMCAFAVMNVYSKQENGNGTRGSGKTEKNQSSNYGDLRSAEKSIASSPSGQNNDSRSRKIQTGEKEEMNRRPVSPPPQDGSTKKGTYTPPKNQVPPPPPSSSTSSPSSSGSSSSSSSSGAQQSSGSSSQ